MRSSSSSASWPPTASPRPATPRWARPPRPRPSPGPDGGASRLLLGWARAIARHRSLPLSSVLSLGEAALLAEAGAVWAEWVRQRAQAAIALPDKDRRREVRRLAASADDDDRHVARLVTEWEARRG
jgi:hypothetical protein